MFDLCGQITSRKWRGKVVRDLSRFSPMETMNLYKNRDAMRSKRPRPRLFGRDNELSPGIELI